MAIKQRAGSENWYYRFTYHFRDYCEGGFRLKSDAETAERKKKNSLEDERLTPGIIAQKGSDRLTFREAGQWYLDTWAAKKSRNDPDHYRMPIIMDYFGEKTIQSATPDDFDKFLDLLPQLRGRPISKQTRNHYLRLLKSFINRLKKKKKYVGENEAEFLDIIKVPAAKVRFLYPEEENLMEKGMKDLPDSQPYYYMGRQTGMRIQEIMQLRVKHVDVVMSHIFISWAKGNQSRYVPLTPEGLEFVKGYMKGKKLEDRLFPNRCYTYILRQMQSVARAMGVPGFGTHVLRHTFAYGHLSQGTPLYVVSKLLGHSSEKVTQDHYGHLAASDLHKAVNRLADLTCNKIATDPENRGQISKQNDTLNSPFVAR